MKRLKDLIAEKKLTRFIGRSNEIQLMMESLVHHKGDWHILHFYGPAGVGKTTLLRRFEQTIAKPPILYLNDNAGTGSPYVFLRCIQDEMLRKSLITYEIPGPEVADTINKIAEAENGLILLLDDLDRWIEIQYWLQEEWLPSLSMKVRICSTGRLPLTKWNSSEIWSELIVSESLPAFPMPLFEEELNDDAEMAEWLAVASLLKYFDHQLLEDVRDKPLSLEQFHRLCRLPYIKKIGEIGWSVADSVRRRVNANRMSNFYMTYMNGKKRAEEALDRRLTDISPDRYWFEQEMAWRRYSLLENDHIQSVLFCGDDEGFTTQPAVVDELPILEQMFADNIDTLSPHYINETQMHSMLTPLWELEPDAVQVVYRNHKRAGFYTFLPLHEETRFMLAQNPISHTFITHGSLEPSDYLVWAFASVPAYDFEIYGYMLRRIIFTLAAGRRITLILSSTDKLECFDLLGFESLDWAHYRSPGGLILYFSRLDLRSPQPFPALYSEQGLLCDPLINTITNLSGKLPSDMNRESDFKDWEVLVKQVLANYKEKHSPKLKEVIHAKYKQLQAGSSTEQIQAKILQHAFLQKKGSHEFVASMLHVPIATYYRHLKRLIITITQSVRQAFLNELERS